MTTDQYLEEYFNQFGEYPPRIFCLDYEDKLYRALIIKAVIRGTKITEQELDQMAEAEPYDVA